MTKYRIKVTTQKSGDKLYYPQYKKCVFWYYFYNRIFLPNGLYNQKIHFNTFESAIKFLKSDKNYINNREQERIIRTCVFEARFDNVIEQEYKYSSDDAVDFVSNLKHNELYELQDLASGEWVKQKYTYLKDNNDQETFDKMVHGFRMGWLRSIKHGN